MRRSAALLAVSAGLVPVALLGGAEAARADTAPASQRYAVGSPAMLVAQDVARRTWGTDPCGGQVAIAWGRDDPRINARSYWSNPVSAYDQPALNTACRIVFNEALDFTWEWFCTVLVHEYGHLAGHPHGPDGPEVMSPVYRAPLPACSATADPAAPPPGVAAAELSVTRTRRGGPAGRPRARAAWRTRGQARSRAHARAHVEPSPLRRFAAASR